MYRESRVDEKPPPGSWHIAMEFVIQLLEQRSDGAHELNSVRLLMDEATDYLISFYVYFNWIMEIDPHPASSYLLGQLSGMARSDGEEARTVQYVPFGSLPAQDRVLKAHCFKKVAYADLVIVRWQN